MGCMCDECKDMCALPCWPTPSEVEKIIALGYGERLMLDFWWPGSKQARFNVVCPAAGRGEAGRYARGTGKRCLFQTKKGLCELHDKCKPMEGRLASCTGTDGWTLRGRVAKTWNTKRGKIVVAAWKKKFYRGD
jgi:hypothetical protein